jgi:NADH:ubiquinone oxidoreductase subunit 4 (subunit M)
VEAPSVGSVILAGILLKLGGYGILRILLPIFPYASCFYLPFIYILTTVSIIYGSLTAIRQLDLKRIVAYSSVAHMNLVVLGLFSNTFEGIIGGTFLMLGHGIVSSFLFFLIGFLYERYGTRLLGYYGGLIKMMPFFSFYFLIGCLANLGLPGTCNFIGEILIFFSILSKNKVLFSFVITSVVFSAVYSLYLYSKLTSGNLTSYISNYSDLMTYEIILSSILFFLIFFLGIFPNFIFEILNSANFLILERIKF